MISGIFTRSYTIKILVQVSCFESVELDIRIGETASTCKYLLRLS